MWILFGNSKVYYIAPALSWRPRVVSWLVVGFDVLLRRRLEIPSKMRARVYVHIHFHSSTTWFLVVIQGKLKNTLTKYIWNTFFFCITIVFCSPKFTMWEGTHPFGFLDFTSKFLDVTIFLERCCIFLLRGKWERKGKFSKVLLQLPFNNGLRSTAADTTSTMVSRRHVLIPGKFQTFPASNTNSYSSHHRRDTMARIIPARSLNSLSINNNNQSFSAQLTGSNHFETTDTSVQSIFSKNLVFKITIKVLTLYACFQFS